MSEDVEYAQVGAVQDRQVPAKRNHPVVILFIFVGRKTYWLADKICSILLLILGAPKVEINISCDTNTSHWYNTRSDRGGCVTERTTRT